MYTHIYNIDISHTYVYIYIHHINPRYISHKDPRSSGGDVLRQCVELGGAPAASLTLKEHDIMMI
jgi:hypothetical protein